MSNHTSMLQGFAERAKRIMARQLDDAADMAELMKEMREAALQGSVLKKWIKAELVYERTGKSAALDRLKRDTQEAALYGAVLGYEIEGFGETTKDFVVNELPAFNPDTGEIIELDRPGGSTAAPVAEPESPDAESADAKAAPNVNAAPAAASQAVTSAANQDSAAPSRHDRTMPAVPLTPEENARLELPKFLDRRGAAAE